MQSNKEIVSEMANMQSVLMNSDYAYYIPEFQRNFVWKEDEINQLLNDFNEDTNDFSVETSSLEGYLLGNVVLIDQGNKKIVVDGQQRLTTLSLIAKGISVVLSEHIKKAAEKNDTATMTSWSKKVGEIDKGFNILDDSDTVKGLKIQHDPSLSFGSYYKKLITGTNSPSDIIKEEDANIDIVYSKIYEFLEDLTDEKFNRFIQYFKTKIKLIITCAPTEAKAFQLFEILNDRGRSLEPMDLIKNLFLKTLNIEGKNELEIKDFNNDWQDMMTSLQLTAKKKISSSTFLKQFLIAFRGDNMKADELFDYFKNNKNVFDGTYILDFISKMSKISKVYREIELENYKAFLDDQNMEIVFKIFSIKQFHPILMLFYEESKENKAKVLDCITRLGAAVLFSYTQTNYIEKIIPAIIKEYWKKMHNDKDRAFNYLIQELDKNTENLLPIMKANLTTRNFVGKNGEVHSKALMILKFIELYFNQNTKILSVPKGKKISVEHILSRNLDMTNLKESDLGFHDNKEKQDYMHRIGNLTLLYNTDNSAVGNNSYSKKKALYANSDFIMTSTLVTPLTTTVKAGMDTKLYADINKYEKQYKPKKEQWTKNLIDKRCNDLATLMEHIVKKS